MNSVLQFSDISQRLPLDAGFVDTNNNSNKPATSDKYSLRPRSLRRDDPEIIPEAKPRPAKPKQKPAPLSKYRRKTANARERTRMREINAAFESLRRAIPHLSAAQCPGNNEKLTKITTLRLAMKYISALTAALGESSGGMCTAPDLGDFLSDCSDLDCLFLESDSESLQLHSDISEHSLTPVDIPTDFPSDFNNSYSPAFSEHSLSPFDTLLSDFA